MASHLTTPDGKVVYLSRPGRAALVAPSLDELTGPTDGIVELPLRLFWRPNRMFDLDQPRQLRRMYENVLRESVQHDELRTYINAEILRSIWRDLNLPRGVRLAWETTHPELRRAA